MVFLVGITPLPNGVRPWKTAFYKPRLAFYRLLGDVESPGNKLGIRPYYRIINHHHPLTKPFF